LAEYEIEEDMVNGFEECRQYRVKVRIHELSVSVFSPQSKTCNLTCEVVVTSLPLCAWAEVGNWNPNNNLKGTKLGSPRAQNLAPTGAQGKIQSMLRAALPRLGTVLHSHSSGLLIHRSGYSHVCSGLEVEMKFGEVKIGVRVLRILAERGESIF
jgi:hypothetical protein